MLTRRETLGILAGPVLAGKASQPSTAVNFHIPSNACDCHTHIYGDPQRFPLSPARVYTPEPALPNEMAALHRALHMRRVVIVTPSVYGTDNSATLLGIKARGKNARGVAVIDETTSDGELDRMAQAGIRGIRINSATAGANDPAAVGQRFQAAAKRVAPHGWHIQIYTNLTVISAIKDLVRNSPVPVVFDHFGGAQAAQGLDQPGFADLFKLVGEGHAYVKISGAYRASTQSPDYRDVVPLAQTLIRANPDRILWGSDWPHPNTSRAGDAHIVTPFLEIDDGRFLNQLAIWAPDPFVREKILVENPARLYGF
jgi:predicted TIM-barrel fold metal-dependent hydrolase